MSRCSQCLSEVADGAGVCGGCGAPADHVALPEPPRPAAPKAPRVTVSGGGFSRRDLTIVALALIGAGAMTFALLLSREASGSRSVEAAAAPAAAFSVKPSAAGTAPGWSTKDRARWLGAARRSFAIDVAAAAPVAVWMKNVRPVLVVRCMAQGPEVFVFTDSAARIEPNTPDHTVRISLDGAPPISERWPDSADHDALFAPDGAAWITRLSQARTMTFGFTPHNSQAVTAEFRVDGLADILRPAARECGTKR